MCFMGFRNTQNFVKNIPLCMAFLTLFSVFEYPDEALSLVFDTLLDIVQNPTGRRQTSWQTIA